MKILVVYYSYGGNAKLIAETLSNELNADIERLEPVKPLNASGIGYVMWGVRQLVSQNKPPIVPLKHNINDYDLIIIGTPVWSYTITPPIRTFLEEKKFTGKKIALFCCHGGNFGKTFDDMKTALNGNDIIGTADFYEPLKNDPDRNCKKAAEWAIKLKYWM